MKYVVALLLLFGLTSIEPAVGDSLSTSGDCSPIVTHVQGNVSISCSIVANRISVYKYEGMYTLESAPSFTDFINQHKDNVVELNIWFAFSDERSLYFLQRDGSNVERLSAFVDNLQSGTEYTLDDSRYFNIAHGQYQLAGYFAIEFGNCWQGYCGVQLVHVSKSDLISRGEIERK
jgi:hypothetical protein